MELWEEELVTYADEIKDNSEIEEQYFEILAYDAENNRSLAVLSTHNANAEVAGNGVRLRNNPNTNSKNFRVNVFR